jgi:hypothetical protein
MRTILLLLLISILSTTSATFLPDKLAVYYGWPSAVNGAGGDINVAAAVFDDYDQVVFGAGLEDPSHGDHANLVAMLALPAMAGVDTFGYIDSTLPVSTVQAKIALWVATGVKGIFLDQFGYDFGLTRDKQNTLVWSIHHASCSTVLSAFVNSWNPDDSLASTVDPVHNPTGVAPLLGSGDWYLLESYQIINGAYQSSTDWRVRSDKATAGRSALSVSLAAVTTIGSDPFSQSKADYSYLSSVMDELDTWGWGEQFFSAGDSMLPWRTRASVEGTAFTGLLYQVGSVWERQTNIGIVVDTSAHTTDEILV